MRRQSRAAEQTFASLRFFVECAKCYFYNWSAHTLDTHTQHNIAMKSKVTHDSSDSTIDSPSPSYLPSCTPQLTWTHLILHLAPVQSIFIDQLNFTHACYEI